MLPGGEDNNFDPYSGNNLKKVILASLLFLAIVTAASFYAYYKYFGTKSIVKKDVANQAVPTTTVNKLPSDFSQTGENDPTDSNDLSKIKAEDLLFSDFYEDNASKRNYQPFNFPLPISVKSDVSNYYEISRKINLDKSIEQLNKNGFSLTDNTFQKEGDSFFNFYNLLNKKDIPILLTSDFLIYNFQNVLKGVYKEIESEIFYKEIWRINKALFEISDAEYKRKKDQQAGGNDPVAEGLRKKAAFFAVLLELLKPKPDQINNAASFDDTKFTPADSLNFDFKMPEYLFDDVKQEISHIQEAKQVIKSPVLLYVKDYKAFKIPEEYKANAKLNNYFMASIWQSSLFPLFYKDQSCPDCLLDKYDWKINMMAACSITKSFSDNQDIKNSWAKVYKVMSFFNGLRSEGTYLNYQKALTENFGPEYKLDDIFSSKNVNMDSDLEKIKDSIYAIQFSELEGGYSRLDNNDKKNIGLRVLQESYWPDNYIFTQLASPYVGRYKENVVYLDKTNITGCKKKGDEFVRCGNIGMDIINIIYPIAPGNRYFFENTNYANYDHQVAVVNKKLLAFDKYSWHNNIYWVNMDLSKKLLESYQNPDKPNPVWQDNDWQYKNVKTALGSWVNLQLPLDKIINNPSNAGKLTETTIGDDDYVEPNTELLSNIISNTDMVKKMLMKLEVVKENDFINKELSRLILDNQKMKDIVEKEIKGDRLSLEDKKNIADISKIFISKSNTKKSFKLKDGLAYESNSGLKMMPYIYKNADKRLIMAIGAVFNYQENRQ
jgi:hypothetical protein